MIFICLLNSQHVKAIFYCERCTNIFATLNRGEDEENFWKKFITCLQKKE